MRTRKQPPPQPRHGYTPIPLLDPVRPGFVGEVVDRAAEYARDTKDAARLLDAQVRAGNATAAHVARLLFGTSHLEASS